MAEFIGTFIIVLVIILIIRGRKRKKAVRYTGRSSSTIYATVFVYNGNFASATYVCDSSYYEKQIVIVDYTGKHYAGRILELDDERPEDIPKNVRFKPIIKPFTWKDKKAMDFWNDRVQEVIEQEIGKE